MKQDGIENRESDEVGINRELLVVEQVASYLQLSEFRICSYSRHVPHILKP